MSLIPEDFKPLTPADLAIPMFDRQRPVRRSIPAREEMLDYLVDEDDEFEDFLRMDAGGGYRIRQEPVIEGVTTTDNFNVVGYTYFCLDGMLMINYWNEAKKENVRILEQPIRTDDDFENCLKKADKKIRRFRS